ncbi:hypothetical protein DPMN_146787 [Dreissena polymorpha]|uniref:Uncharacterized protein n=1 Tax=Dreissena polymorpha TaxID=45954 RepID=A0A9D4J014_DREPO|nr:hypothetical protein DPMN_146787 [Dreissena polymorpha]
MSKNENPCVDRAMLTNENPCVDQEMLTNANPCVDRDMSTNKKPCGDPEVLASLDSYCGGPDIFTSHDSFNSKDKEQFWYDKHRHGQADLVSLTQHVSEHIGNSMANTNDSHVGHTSHTGHLSSQEPITDVDVSKQVGNTRLGLHESTVSRF